MIFADANVFLRAMMPDEWPGVAAERRVAIELFRRVELGELELTTSEAVIAEVAFVLTARRHYGLSVEKAVALLLP